MTLPLWNPTLVELGAVGYLSKLTGTFVTLFTAFHPEESSNGSVQGMASLYGYGHVKKGSQRLDERNVAQRGLDAFVGLLTFRGRSGGPISCVAFFCLSCWCVLVLVLMVLLLKAKCEQTLFVSSEDGPQDGTYVHGDYTVRLYGELGRAQEVVQGECGYDPADF